MADVKSSRHSRYLLMYHMVWCPKYRRRILADQVADRLKQILQQVAADREWEVMALAVMPDHVHLFASAPPTFSPANLVKVFKGISARLLLKEFPHLARQPGRGTLWAPSYFVGSAGQVAADTIRRYIEEQSAGG